MASSRWDSSTPISPFGTSALRAHHPQPCEVWMAIDRKAREPRVDSPPIRIVRSRQGAPIRGVD